MTSRFQKDRELYFASALARVLDVSWKIESAPSELEWPDLVVDDGWTNFGLEVKEVMREADGRKGSRQKSEEAKRDRQIQAVADLYYQASDIPLSVSFVGDIQESGLVKESLLDFARTSGVGDRARLDMGPLSSVHVARLRDHLAGYRRWKHCGAGWVSRVGMDFVLPHIREKEERLEKYRRHLSDVRLLLVADRTRNSGRFEFENMHPLPDRKFNCVYVLQYPEIVHQL